MKPLFARIRNLVDSARTAILFKAILILLLVQVIEMVSSERTRSLGNKQVPDRFVYRNDCRERALQFSLGTLCLKISKLCKNFCMPGFLDSWNTGDAAWL